MNTRILSLLAILLAAAVAQAAAPTRAVVDADYDWSQVTNADTISSSTGYDTLGEADSSSLLSNFVPQKGYQYILVRDAFTGTGSDSTSVQLRLSSKDCNKSLLYTTAVDSMTSSAGEAIVLPFGETAFGCYFDLKLMGYGDDGGQLIVNRVYLYKRRAITTTQDWQVGR